MAVTERSVLVRLRANVSDYNRAMVSAGASTKAFVKDLESSNDRMSMIVQSSLALGPALVPIGAAVVPAISGMTAALGFAAVGAGATALAFSGVGGALKALNDYQIAPTDAHLRKLNETMNALGPAGRDFAMTLQEMRPELQKLQDTAQAGMLPGVTDGINELMQRMPEVQGILENVSTTLGSLARDAGRNLASPEFDKFFEYIKTEAGPALDAMGQSVGLVLEGIGNMVMAFDPLNDDFFSGIVHASEAFRDWSANMGESDGFQHFIDYVEKVGPQVWDTLGAIASALIDIVTAAAPVGQGVLIGLEGLAHVFSLVAASPVGPVLLTAAAGLAAVSRAVALYNLVNGGAMSKLLGRLGSFQFKGTTVPKLSEFGTVLYRAGQSAEHVSEQTLQARNSVDSFAKRIGPAVGVMGGLALASSGVADKVGLQNTALYASLGLMIGPWGGAIGAAAGLAKDFAAANNDVTDTLKAVNDVLDTGDTEQYAAALDRLQQQATDLATGTGFEANLARISAFVSGQDIQMRHYADFLKDGMHDTEIGAGDLASVFGDSLAPTVDLTTDAFERAAIGADGYKDSLEGINAFLDKRAAFREYQKSIDDVAEGLQKRAEIQQAINDAEAQGAKERADIANSAGQKGADGSGDLAQMRRKLADAQADARGGKTATQRQNAAQRVLDIEKQIHDYQTGRGRDAADTAALLQDSYDKQAKAIADLKKQLADLSPGAKTGNQGGRENQARLDDIAKSAINAAGFMDDGFKRNKFLADARKEYIKNAETFGIDPKKARRDATKSGLLALPEKPAPIEVDANTKPAVEKLTDLEKRIKKFERTHRVDLIFGDTGALAYLEMLRAKLAKIRNLANVQVHVDGRLGPIRSAAGNVLSGGDIANGHLPGVYAASAVPRVFAEPETKGESYIPHANDWRRPRALSIWEETGRILGVQFRHYAAGDVVRSAAQPSYATYGAGAGIDYSRLASAVAAGSPLYGDVHIQPHNYSEFTRQMEADHRAAAMGSESFK